jgi:hypothetical protein
MRMWKQVITILGLNQTIMKAIRIDAKSKRIESVDLGPQLSDIYEMLNCEIFTVAYPQTVEPIDDVIYVDDEALLKNTDDIVGAFFIDIYPAQPLFGHALIVGTDLDGNSTDTSFSIEQISDMVHFLERDEIKMYQELLTKPPQIFTF